MQGFSATFIESIQRTPSVVSFRFRPGQGLSFQAGQFVKVLFDAEDKKSKELNKYLSFSCAPGLDYFELTKRLSDSLFSQRLQALAAGDELLFEGPLGNCILPRDPTKIGFLIGGIGITPVISMLETIAAERRTHDVVLLYSNKVKEEVAFKTELDSWQQGHDNIRVIYTLTDCEPARDECVYGKISADLLASEVPDFLERLFFVFGPPVMVKAMKQLCLDVGCLPERVKTETFVGYE